jgi:folate-dependent tRNA-U54 methylase TrmFO/GidA
MATGAFSTVKIFSCTLARDREQFGERITEWLKQHPELTPVETVVTQSSDQEFHCLTVTLFLVGEIAADRPVAAPKRVVPRPLR